MKNSVLSSCTLKRIKLKCEVCGDNFYSDVIKYECRKCKNFPRAFKRVQVLFILRLILFIILYPIFSIVIFYIIGFFEGSIYVRYGGMLLIAPFFIPFLLKRLKS